MLVGNDTSVQAAQLNRSQSPASDSSRQNVSTNKNDSADSVTISKQAQKLAADEISQIIKNETKKNTAEAKQVMEMPGGARYVMATGREIKSSAEKLVDDLV